MEMEDLDNNDVNTHNIAKGKRTKRLRLLSPCGVSAAATTVMMTSSCSSANSGASFSSTTTTNTYESTDQEEEDMANCLILLAQGGGKGDRGGGDSLLLRHHHHGKQQGVHEDNHHNDDNKTEKGNRILGEMATATANSNTKVGFYIYECKTCNRTFPSFQALGGHRASHKKPKLMLEEKKSTPPPLPSPLPPPPMSSSSQFPHLVIANYDQFEDSHHIKSGPPISLQLGNHGHRTFHGNNNKAKIHECSICGSEFTSGQALGGHMRRHRAFTNTNDTTTVVTATTRPRNILQLDLNLPAPEDDLRETKFQFTASRKSMVLAGAPALVDCHY